MLLAIRSLGAGGCTTQSVPVKWCKCGHARNRRGGHSARPRITKLHPRPPKGGGACSVTVTVIVAVAVAVTSGSRLSACSAPSRCGLACPRGPRLGACCLHAYMAVVCVQQRWHTAARVRKGKISREPVRYGTVVAAQSLPRVMLISLPGSAPTATVPRLVAGG